MCITAACSCSSCRKWALPVVVAATLNFLFVCLLNQPNPSQQISRSPLLTWHAFRGWGRGGRGWPCSTRCCFHTASDSEPWRRASDSYRSRGCALRRTERTNHESSSTVHLIQGCSFPSRGALTILCLYSSEASCTAVSQALEPLA